MCITLLRKNEFLYNGLPYTIIMQSEMNVEGLLKLPVEMWEEIVLKMPISDILNFCSVSKELHKICENDAFWRRKTHAEFPGTEKRVSPSIEDTWKEEYKTLSRPSLSIPAMIDRMEKIDGRWWMYYGEDRDEFINTATYEELKDRLVNRYYVDFTAHDYYGDGIDYGDELLCDVEAMGDILADALIDKHIWLGRAFDRLIKEKEVWTLEIVKTI